MKYQVRRRSVIFLIPLFITTILIMMNMENKLSEEYSDVPFKEQSDEYTTPRKNTFKSEIDTIKSNIEKRDELLIPTLSRKDYSFVMVVQVHNRPEMLKFVIESMKKLQDVQKALIIFSHDFFSESINKLIDTIDFCDKAQIFMPHSIQLNPDHFPGSSPDDCPRDIDPKQAKTINCSNADWPDKYGHYREAKFTQIKHHWWWKANTVFDKLRVTKNLQVPFIFLEEDQYLLRDTLSLIHQQLVKVRQKYPNGLLTIGGYQSLNSIDTAALNHVKSVRWKSTKHNIGMVLERENWEKIKKCRSEFCHFDDYNWDWTLQYIFSTCVKPKLYAAYLNFPRVHHIGLCGVHVKKRECDPSELIKKIENFYLDNQAVLNPENLILTDLEVGSDPYDVVNGGWGDKRDHELCLQMSS